MTYLTCDFQRQSGNYWKCSVCEWTTWKPSDKPPLKTCGTSDPFPPGMIPIFRDLRPLITRLAAETETEGLDDRYGPAVARWEADGFPVRTPDDLEYIVNTICPACQKHRDGFCTCKTCGAKPLLIRVRAYMGSEDCPGMW